MTDALLWLQWQWFPFMWQVSFIFRFHLQSDPNDIFTAREWKRHDVSLSRRCDNYRFRVTSQRCFPDAECTLKHRVKWTELKWQNDTSDKQPLPSPRLSFCRSLLSGLRMKGVKHSAPQTGRQSAAAICQHPLADQNTWAKTAEKRGSKVILSADFCSWSAL